MLASEFYDPVVGMDLTGVGPSLYGSAGGGSDLRRCPETSL